MDRDTLFSIPQRGWLVGAGNCSSSAPNCLVLFGSVHVRHFDVSSYIFSGIFVFAFELCKSRITKYQELPLLSLLLHMWLLILRHQHQPSCLLFSFSFHNKIPLFKLKHICRTTWCDYDLVLVHVNEFDLKLLFEVKFTIEADKKFPTTTILARPIMLFNITNRNL